MAAGVRNVILAEFTPYDPVAAAPVTVRACSVDDASVTSLNGVAWWPAISQAPRRTIDLFDGEFGGRISAAIGDIEISTAAFPLAPRFSWGEQPVKLWRGVLGAAWGSYTQIFQGLTRPARGANGRLRIGLRVDDRWLDRPLLSTYAGTGNAEGPADLRGVPKPLALGTPQFIEGVLINRALNIYQLHGYGAMQGVTVALDRLNRYGAAAGNDATYAALAAATIAPGAWRTCLAEGLVRFGAPPAGVVTFLAQGDSGSALGWVRTPGQVIRRIALVAGATAGQINATSLAALDTAVPFNISRHLRDQTTAREVIQSIAASCNASAGVSHMGTLFVARTVIGSPTLTLRADGAALPPVASVELLEQSAPFWRVALDAVRTERVHSAGEYADLPPRGIVTYRQPTTPVDPLNGDLWFDTDFANIQYRYRSTGSIEIEYGGVSVEYGGVSLTYQTGVWDTVRDGLILEAQRTADGKRGLVATGLARNGDVVAFIPPLAAVPVMIFGSGGIAGAATDNRIVAASGLTTSGFTMRAVAQAVSGASSTVDTGATAGGVGEPDLVINRTNSAAPFDGRYTFEYEVLVLRGPDIGPGEPGTWSIIDIGIWIKRSGAWIQVGSARHSAGGGGVMTITVTPGAVDFGVGAEFGVSVEAVDGEAYLTAFNSVTYASGTATETSLTPTNSSPIEWQAWL
jgi:hypothetical protein